MRGLPDMTSLALLKLSCLELEIIRAEVGTMKLLRTDRYKENLSPESNKTKA